MAFAFKKHEPVSDALRRVARAQLARAAASLGAAEADMPKAVHDARVRIKRVRAVLTLAGDALKHHARAERDDLRDIAHSLAAFRDAAALGEAFTRVRDHFGSLDPHAFESVARAIAARATLASTGAAAPTNGAASLAHGAHAPLAAARDRLLAAAARAHAWPLDGDGFALIRPGLHDTYQAARHARHDALDSPDPAARHEWRKDAKRLAEQLRLLRRVWPAMMKAHSRALLDLSAALGHEHDLTLLAQSLRAEPDAFGPGEAAPTIARLADRAARDAVDEARPLARRALAEKTSAFIDRVEALWDAWHR